MLNIQIENIVEIEIVEKFNPYHGTDGRFTSSGGAASFTFAPGKSKAHDKAIASEKVKDNPYKHLRIEEIDQKMNNVFMEMNQAAKIANLETGFSSKLDRKINAAKKKYKNLQAKYKQLDQAYSYVQRYGDNNIPF